MRVLVTGATSGIGKALTLAYANQGDEVVACGRNSEKLRQLQLEQAHLGASDTNDDYSIKKNAISTLTFELTELKTYPQLADDFAPLDLLILNAGDCEYIDNAHHFDAQLFERVIKVNLIAIGYCLQTWLKHLKPGGRVVFISSSAAFLPLPRAEAYGCTKAALSYLAKTLSISLSEQNIEVTLVHPGFVKTQLTDRNTFAMPMIVTSEQAANIIVSGIAKGKSEINFPRLFIWIMKCLNALPLSLWRKLAVMGVK